MSKKIFVKDIRSLPQGGSFDTVLLVAGSSLLQTSRGSDYLALTLADKTGTIPGRYWDATPEAAKVMAEGAVCLVGARADTYKGAPQLIVQSARAAGPGEYDPADLAESSPHPLGEMKERLLALAGSLGDPDLRALVLGALSHGRTQSFWTNPAGRQIHHAYVGGLLEHTLSVSEMAEAAARHYGPGALSRDVLVAGAIIHDIGKCWEFVAGPPPAYTLRGNLTGHIAMGVMFLELLAAGMPGFPHEKLLLMEHMILAHHGELGKGSPVTPKILEATVLNHLDEMDARVNGLSSFIKAETGGRGMVMTGWHKNSGSALMSTPSWDEGDPPRPDGPDRWDDVREGLAAALTGAGPASPAEKPAAADVMTGRAQSPPPPDKPSPEPGRDEAPPGRAAQAGQNREWPELPTDEDLFAPRKETPREWFDPPLAGGRADYHPAPAGPAAVPTARPDAARPPLAAAGVPEDYFPSPEQTLPDDDEIDALLEGRNAADVPADVPASPDPAAGPGGAKSGGTEKTVGSAPPRSGKLF
ncbi:MAG: HDIG domain-containing protein [Deltaproteobacteria bacterium]|jgi:3'-5' exoribonuclease|nr:HDIG domain-containing protein [Deltaproteobacteria bacterium]